MPGSGVGLLVRVNHTASLKAAKKISAAFGVPVGEARAVLLKAMRQAVCLGVDAPKLVSCEIFHAIAAVAADAAEAFAFELLNS